MFVYDHLALTVARVVEIPEDGCCLLACGRDTCVAAAPLYPLATEVMIEKRTRPREALALAMEEHEVELRLLDGGRRQRGRGGQRARWR